MPYFLTIIRFLHTTKLYLFPVGLLVLLFLLNFHNREITAFPGISNKKIIPYDDHEQNGNSKILEYNNDSLSILLRYSLHDALSYPYAGFKIIFDENTRFRDLSSYDYLFIDLSIKKQMKLDIFFHTVMPENSDFENVFTYRYLYNEYNCLRTQQQVKLPIKSFKTPGWWYYTNKIPENSLGKDRFKQVAELIIQSGTNNPINQTFEVSISKISFGRDLKKRGLLFLTALLAWGAIYSFLYFLYNMETKNSLKKRTVVKKIEQPIEISYNPLDVSNDSDDNLARLVAYIAKEYKNPGLTVSQVASEVGISLSNVSQILRDKKNCSYKQYLNAIRLTEAKRLLSETDRNIVDIALKVGYNTVTHFNRIFKEIEGISPRQFRAMKLKDKEIPE